MKRLLTASAIAWMVLLSTGCMSITMPEMDMAGKGRWGELEVRMEKRVKDLSSASTYDLYFLCEAYTHVKRYSKLFTCLDQLETNIKKGKRKVFLIDVSPTPNVMRANAYIELGDYSRAVTEAEKALNICHKTGHQLSIIDALSTLSLAHALNGNRLEAIKYTDAIKDSRKGAWSGKAMGHARTYMALGDYQKSLEYIEGDVMGPLSHGFVQVSATMTGIIVPDESISIETTLPMAFIFAKSLYETGRIMEARKQYDILLEKPQTRFFGDIYWVILYDRGKIEEKEGKLKEGIEFYTKAVDVIELQRSTINTEAGKIGFVGDKQAVYHRLVLALYQDKQYEKAFEYVERAKARALVDILASKKDFAVKGGNEREIKTVFAMNEAVEEEAINQDSSVDKNKTRSIQIKTRQALRDKAPELAALVTVTSQPVSEIQSLIPKEEILIEYYYRNRDMYAFILSDGKLQTVKLNSEGLAEDVHALRKLIDRRNSTQFMEMSRKLHKRLFQPLERVLNKRNLIIVSHGVMHYLPMNALHDGNGYLIDRYSIRMMPSASAMKYLREKKAAKEGGVLIFGNPDLGDPKHNLEYAQREAAEIARMQPKSKMFVRKEATEETLRKYCKDYRYIHFATHGQFNPDAPLKSALLLASDARSDGMLTVDKLYSLHIDADLVTLSSCETGLSKIANGDDLVGLTRGFLYAGSSSIVASLWKVDDLATAQLMTRFYSELDKINKREALRIAQLETKKKYPHPYYWASFQLTGSAK